jgi:acetylornithine deacetylase/succinyl-diaminopimelate desuccinylase-like protein
MIIGSVICGHGDTYELKGACFLPDICTIIVDARYLPGTIPHDDIEKVLEGIKSEDPEFDYEMHIPPEDPALPGLPWHNDRIKMPPQDLSPDELIVKVYAENYRNVTGKEPSIGAIPPDDPRHHMTYAGDDDAHLTEAGIPSFCIGPGGGWNSTGPDPEYADIDSMMTIAKTYALTAYDICTTLREESPQTKKRKRYL